VTDTTATSDWTGFDTVGGYVPTSQQTLQFRPGLFLEAVRTGRWLVIDEINRAEIDKAFGELFTLLSGQKADLPYVVGPDRVRVLPPADTEPHAWVPAGVLSGYDYIVHPNWRILATMNVYDRASLFAMSLAFMRRFAFVDIDLPGDRVYHELVERWFGNFGPDVEGMKGMLEILYKLVAAGNPLMRRRALGPALIKDMILYIADRAGTSPEAKLDELLCEAVLLFVTPQLDGLPREVILTVNAFLGSLFGDCLPRKQLLARIASLYPYIDQEEWIKAAELDPEAGAL
jgi:hypothetical protein